MNRIANFHMEKYETDLHSSYKRCEIYLTNMDILYFKESMAPL